jgi:Family of unknown function (DUF6477)
MTDFRTNLSALRRPRLLLNAARHGLADYRRDRDLRRLIDAPVPPETALPRLFCEEDALEQRRRAGDAGYPVTRHIEVLVALMAEARLLSQVTG